MKTPCIVYADISSLSHGCTKRQAQTVLFCTKRHIKSFSFCTKRHIIYAAVFSDFYSHKLRHPHLQPDTGKPQFRDLFLERIDMQKLRSRHWPPHGAAFRHWPEGTVLLLLSCYSTVIKNTARMVLVKARNHGFYQYRSGWFYFSLSGVNTVEAGYPGIPRSINMGIRVRLCSDWCLR